MRARFLSALILLDHQIRKFQITLCLFVISCSFWILVGGYPPELTELEKLGDPRLLINREQDLLSSDSNLSFQFNDYQLDSPHPFLNPNYENLFNRVAHEEERHLFHGSVDNSLYSFAEHLRYGPDDVWISQYQPVSNIGHYKQDEHISPWLEISNHFLSCQPSNIHSEDHCSSKPSPIFFDNHKSNILHNGKRIRLTNFDQNSHHSFQDSNFGSEIPRIMSDFQRSSIENIDKKQSQYFPTRRESHQMDPLQLKKPFESTDSLPSAKDMTYNKIHQPHKFQSGGSYNSGYLSTNLNNSGNDVFNVAHTGLNKDYVQNGLQSDQPLDLDSANTFLNCESNDPSEKSSARICNSDTDATERVKKLKGVYHKQLGFLATSNIGSKNPSKKKKENLVNPVMPKVIFNERERTKATSNLEEFSSQQKSENLKSSSRQDKIKNSSNSKIILTSLMEKNKFAINSESSSRAIGFTTPLISKTFLPDFPNIGSIRFKIELKNIIDNLDEEAEAFNDHKKIELIILLSEPSHSYAGTVVKKWKKTSEIIEAKRYSRPSP
ncbi:hypothetical protein BY996DRAFT_8683907 [Phakopsora pachyrhizi]|nr:hypothetical protein BY996DRAFT_8683907 [Phakopsora pachyrhizi]